MLKNKFYLKQYEKRRNYYDPGINIFGFNRIDGFSAFDTVNEVNGLHHSAVEEKR